MPEEITNSPAERELFTRHPELEPRFGERVQALRDESVRYQRTLVQNREAREKTRLAVVAELGIEPGEVAELERRADLYFATLDGHVHDLGGELRLLAVFEGKEFELKLSDLAGDTETRPVVVAEEPVAA